VLASIREKGAALISYRQLAEVCGRVGHVCSIARERSIKRIMAPFYSLMDKDLFLAKRRALKMKGFDFDAQFKVLEEMVETMRPFVINLASVSKKPIRVWTDADDECTPLKVCIAGHVGGIIEIDGVYHYFYERLPDAFVKWARETAEARPRNGRKGPVKLIHLFESVAVTFAAKVVARLAHSRFVDFFCDNKTAFASGKMGWSSNPDVSAFAHETHKRLGGADLSSVWFYVHTDYNISDGLTREEYIPRLLEKLGDMDAKRIRVSLRDVCPRGIVF
jgi:hypothetical protein